MKVISLRNPLAIIALTSLFGTISANAEEIALLSSADYDNPQIVAVTDGAFKVTSGDADVNGSQIPVISLTASFSTDDQVAEKAWHGLIIRPVDALPAGTLTFEYKPINQAELWVLVTGKDLDGKVKRLDFPIQMYGANLANVGEWNAITLNLKKGHVVGEPPGTFGELETVESLQFQMHPHAYKHSGSYEWLFADFQMSL